MPRLSLEQTAHTIECFLNALRLKDGADRTGLESILVRWLASPAHHRTDCIVYIDSKVVCRSRGQEISAFEVPQACQDNALWCDGKEIARIAPEPFRNAGKFEKLGADGLDFTLPSD